MTAGTEGGTTTPPGGQGNAGNVAPLAPPQQTVPQPNTGPEKTFTQADLDRIIDARFAKVKEQYADYDQLKSRAENWDKFVQESKTDQEKALDQARQQAEQSAYAKARSEFGTRLVETEIRARAAGRMSEGALSALLAGVNTSVFMSETGDIDTSKISSFIDGIAPATTPQSIPGGFGQGPRTGAPGKGIDAGRAAFEARHKPGTAPPLFS